MFNLVEQELKRRENISITENGAAGYKSSGSKLLDLNYAVTSLRDSNEEEIISLFDAAYFENEEYALKWLFFARDIREGLGERRLFRICYKRLWELNPEAFCKNLKNISEYGRWDDLVSLIGIEPISDKFIIEIIKNQIKIDIENLSNNRPISLLAKWLPSENASSKTTKRLAKKVISLLEIPPREYRILLSNLRKYLRVVEVDMCSNNWENIDYEKVPSLANLRYKEAFLKHDESRRLEYLHSVSKGTKKMNMKAATPVDVVSRYSDGYRGFKEYDPTLELAWKNLKNIFIDETLVVADGSGSMTVPVSGNTTALDVANALAIYTSEHNSGVYKDKYITFSNRPQFVDLTGASKLLEKLEITKKHCEISNTDVEAVFQLILDIAVKNNLPQEEMIKNVLIISDMEFDRAQGGRSRCLTETLFEEIEGTYNIAGYKLPKLIFWNVNSRTKLIPLKENEMGVTLVSGFSQNVLKMVMSSKYDPYEVLIDALNDERYEKIKI